MSSLAEHGEHGASEHHHPNYVKVWAILVVLLLVSIIGPEFGIQWVTLATAFGVAVVKAYMVAKNFMHLNIERSFIIYLLGVCLALMFLFFFAVAPDVMNHYGLNWENYGAENMSGAPASAGHGGHGAEGEAAPASGGH